MKDLRVALITPPYFKEPTFPEKFLSYGGKGSPTIALPYLMSWQKGYGEEDIEWKVIEARLEHLSPYKTLELLKNFHPDVVAWGSFTSTVKDSYRFLKLAKPELDATFIGGGHHYQEGLISTVEEGLKNGFDIICRGEAEIQFTNTLHAISTDGDLSKVRGISYVENGKITHNERQEPVMNLDEIPFPAWEECPIHLYPFSDRKGIIISTRSCPLGCRFCQPYEHHKIKPYRERSPKNVVDEIEEQINDFNIKEIFFADDNAFQNIKRANMIFDEMKKRGINLEISAGMRADAIYRGGKNFLRKFKRAGGKLLFIGVESLEDRILKIYDKRETAEQIKRALDLCHKEGIPVLTSIIISPYDDPMSIIKTSIACFKSMSTQVLPLTPLPGTKLYDDLIKAGENLSKDWDDYNMMKFIPIKESRMSVETLSKFFVGLSLALNFGPWQFMKYWRETKFKLKKTVEIVASEMKSRINAKT